MAVKIFVMGRPGSGKTTAAHFIAASVRNSRYSIKSLNDYDFLKKMFQADTEYRKFSPTDHGGFDVLDFSVLDVALREIEEEVQELMPTTDLITIEFARNEYREAMMQFNTNFLKDACFLFIDADLDTCLERIHGRVANPKTADDHPSLSDRSFRKHYCKDNRPFITSDLQSIYALERHQVMIIENMSTKEEFGRKLTECAAVILQFLQDNLSVLV